MPDERIRSAVVGASTDGQTNLGGRRLSVVVPVVGPIVRPSAHVRPVGQPAVTTRGCRPRSRGRRGRRRGAPRARRRRSRRRARPGRPSRRRGRPAGERSVGPPPSVSMSSLTRPKSSGQHEHRGEYPSRGDTSAHHVSRPCRTAASRRCTSSAGGGAASASRPGRVRGRLRRRARPGRASRRTGSPATSGRRTRRRPGAARRNRRHPPRREAPRRTEAPRWVRRVLRRPGGPDRGVAHGRVPARFTVGQPHLEPDAALHGGVHRVLGPVQRAAVQVERERAPAPRRGAREAAEAVGGRVSARRTVQHRCAVPGPRGFRAGAAAQR